MVAPRLLGQTAPAPAAAPGSSSETTEEVVKLSPFVVESTEGTGYRAQSTLAGTRVRTDLKDVASSISVVTADFLRDIGATNNQTLLQYTTNTEVGGVYGNYAGVGSTYINGASESSNFLKPDQNTRVRGLDSADNTRDYFLTDIPWDSYNVGRVDLQRGPNSILFGIGSPAGIVNTSVNSAEYKNQGKLENRLGSFGTVRNSFDFNRVLLADELAVRVSALNDDTKYREKPAFNNDKRLFGALRWDPKVFERWDSTARTTVRANYEYGDVKADRPRILPPEDRITPFFNTSPGGINKTAYDPYYVWAAGLIGYLTGNTDNGQSRLSKQFWAVQYPGPGLAATSNPMVYYDNAGTGTISLVREGLTSSYWALSSNGTRDGQIGGIPYGSPVGIAGYSEFAGNVNATYTNQFPGASTGFYKNRSITDTSIFDFYNTLLDGPNKREWNGWNAYNLVFDQTFLNNRIGIDLVYDRQRYHDGQERNLNNPYITVDIDANAMADGGWSYGPNRVVTFNGNSYLTSNGAIAPNQVYSTASFTRTPTNPTPGTNPNAGRAFVGSGLNNGGNSSNITDRESIRATITGELRFDDFMQKSRLTDLLGRHVFTGLYSNEDYRLDHREWVRYAVTGAYAEAIGDGGGGVEGLGNGTGGLIGGDRVLDWVTYLTDPLWDKSSASGLHIPGISAVQSPSGSATMSYYDSHWKYSLNPTDPSYVNPGAVWNNPTVVGTGNPVSTQSENPANYVGLRTGNFQILNADQGDLDSLYTGGAKVRKVTTSQAVTWQAYFLDDTLVGTLGWRHDQQTQAAGNALVSTATGAASMNYGLDYSKQATSTGNSLSWGLVLHTPKVLREKLPWGSDIALTYSFGKNMRVENRYGFDGKTLPNARGVTRDYGIVLSTLNDKIQLKATVYDTKVYDANLSSVTTEVSTLGSNTYYLYLLEAWGTADALMDVAGMAGAQNFQGWDWFWDYANIDSGWPGGDLLNPNSTAFLTHPSTIMEKAAIQSWFAQMQPQAFFDAYGFHVDVAKVKAGDYAHAVNNGAWQPSSGVGSIQADGKGRINGSYPTGTVDNESKGIEFEFNAQPTKNWNITANASKQKATEVSLGAPISNFIEAQHKKFLSPAGDLRLWWGGDTAGSPEAPFGGLRIRYNQAIWAPYIFQKGAAGRMVSEMSPWRFNFITNYSFDHGLAKGANVGLAYRWEQAKILGYGINATGDNLDVNKPFWGKSEYWVDVWAGYGRKLSSKVDWRIQLNLHNVASKPHLTRISVQPDGGPAQFRIEEGQTWELTNTFTF